MFRARVGWPAALGVAALALILSSAVPAAAWEIDATATVDRVIDGDTFDTVEEGRVRLADIDTPDVGEPGAKAATEFLTDLILGREVHLDIDDVYEIDRYGRLVAVTYVRHNATHLLNVNKALLEADLAVVWDFPNEFDPAEWTLYVYAPTNSAPPPEEPAQDELPTEDLPTEDPPPEEPTEPSQGGTQSAPALSYLFVGVVAASVVLVAVVLLRYWRPK